MDAERNQFFEDMDRRVFHNLRDHFDERWREAENRIIQAFAVCHESTNLRMCKIEADLSNVKFFTAHQLDAFQSKLLELETRIINLERPQG